MSDSLNTGVNTELSKSVTKVQKLPNISDWTDYNAILRDFIKIFFTKRSSILRMKQHLPARKRVSVLTPDDILFVYETNCTGYCFNIRNALRMKTSCYGHNPDTFEKFCTVTFKYNFGYVSLVLANKQIAIWRQTVSAVFEREPFTNHLITDLSLYTAKDDDIDETLITNRSNFNYSESVISLKSARGFTDLSPSQEEVTIDQTGSEKSSLKINSNRSSTCLPLTICSNNSLVSVESKRRNSSPVKNNNNKNIISVRQGSLAVSYLAKKFESKIKMGGKEEKVVEEEIPNGPSSPLEALFPAIPDKKEQEKIEEIV